MGPPLEDGTTVSTRRRRGVFLSLLLPPLWGGVRPPLRVQRRRFGARRTATRNTAAATTPWNNSGLARPSLRLPIALTAASVPRRLEWRRVALGFGYFPFVAFMVLRACLRSLMRATCFVLRTHPLITYIGVFTFVGKRYRGGWEFPVVVIFLS